MVQVALVAKVEGLRGFFFNDTATTEIYTLSLHDALPISVLLGFERVTALAALVVPTFWFPKSGTGEGERPGRPAPVPVTLAVCGLLLALSVTVNVALRVPTAVGVNVTSIEQLAPAARLAPQLFVCEKSPLLVPVKPMLEILRGELVPFCSATA